LNKSKTYSPRSLSKDQLSILRKLHLKGLSSRKIAKILSVGKSTINDTLNGLGWRAQTSPRVLMFDLETTPELSYTWGRWKQNISQGQVVEHPYVLTWAAKFLGEDTIYSDKLTNYPAFSKDIRNDYHIITSLIELINQADMVVAHNGDKFDVPWLRSRILFHGLPPLQPNKFYDTLKVSKKLLRLPSFSLASICKYYGLTDKLDNEGFPLWRACMEGDVDAFNRMEEYNRGDIASLEAVYLLLRSHDPQHPNLTLTSDNSALQCHACGHTEMVKIPRKYRTQVSEFDLYKCTSCGAHQRSRSTTKTKEQRTRILMPC